MVIRNIFQEGNECLKKKCKSVDKFDHRLHTLLDDLRDTMRAAEGAGLAAPQVGILRRVAVIEADGVYLEMVNPVIVERSGEQIAMEGCLSVNPDKNCLVARAKDVVVEAYDRHGNKYAKKLSDLAARACQHELDHLDGVLFYTKKYQGNGK
jgi:peptide deformylase